MIGLVAVVLGTVLAWLTGLAPPDGPKPSGFWFYAPIPAFTLAVPGVSH